MREFEATASSLGVSPVLSFVQDASQIEPVFAEIASEVGAAIVVLPDAFTLAQRSLVLALAERFRVPAIYGTRYMVATGGLISYGPTTDGLFSGLAKYVDRILRGTAPGELPVQAPTKYELVVNTRTAKALGIAIPPTLLARADEVIE